MKIGILTFHSQLNYGGVLQCLALQTALEKMGHKVVVIDRWMNEKNSTLELEYGAFGFKQWIKFAIRASLGLGDMSQWLRVRRTKRFLKQYINRTPYHFADWREAPKDLGVDMLVVGSDQVWNCDDWCDPTTYLLEGAPHIPAIAYAASFGRADIPAEYIALYKRGFSKFGAISCREEEGVEICRQFGVGATHVADPTLLSFYHKQAKRKVHGDLVCYFLSESVDANWHALSAFARKNKCKVIIFVNNAHLLPFPANLAHIKQWLKWQIRKLISPVRIMDSAGPEELVKAFKNARYVLSDSFHALMFSICNNCNARLIRPTCLLRRQMFARIEEFAAHTEGPLIADSVTAALESLSNGENLVYDYEWINRRCSESLEWLKSALIINP